MDPNLRRFTQKLKVIVVGPSGVGKSCISGRLVLGRFVAEQAPTPGAVFYTVDTTVPNSEILRGGLQPPPGMALDPAGSTTVAIDLWDTAGGEEYFTLSEMFFRNAEGCLLVNAHGTDDTDRLIELTKRWNREVQTRVPGCIVILATNKADLPASEHIPEHVVAELARATGAVAACDTSALNGQGVKDSFQALVTACLRKRLFEMKDTPEAADANVDIDASSKSRGCCKL